MISKRCKETVASTLDNQGIRYLKVELGHADIEKINHDKWGELNNALKANGYEIIRDHNVILVEKIKNIVIDLVHYSDEWPKTNLSVYLNQKLFLDYNYMSNVFSMETGTTIEQFTIRQKVNRVKELLSEAELNITEIAYKMNYSSVAHLSNQFKKVTGMSPSMYRKMRTIEQPAYDPVLEAMH
ncbi:MAG: helix-turn-helix domain-containing protein [Bacteroidota bacterium]